jgi:NADH:ubiquinone oxidoreductase subunit E
VLSENVKAEIKQFKGKYPDPRSALLTALHVAQREHGWLSPEVMRDVAEVMDLPPTEVASVTSFYTMFNRQPVGENLIQVCTNISCPGQKIHPGHCGVPGLLRHRTHDADQRYVL